MSNDRFPFRTLLLSAIVLLAGCTKTVTEVQPATTGTIMGRIALYEMDGAASTSSAGATVSVLGKRYQTTTDNSGVFALNNVPAGYYQFRFTKPGFTEFIEQYPESFVGVDTDWTAYDGTLYRINNWKVVLSQANIVGTQYNLYSGDTFFYLAPRSSGFATVQDSMGQFVLFDKQVPSLAFYAGRTPNIDYRDTNSYFQSTNATSYNTGNFMTILRSLAGTDTIYLVAYPLSGRDGSTEYYAVDTLKKELTGFGPPSNVIKVVLP